MGNKKYRLVNKTKIVPRSYFWSDPHEYKAKVYQLKALRDIPEHGVKAGDLGGYVSGRNILSHEGSCWIGEGAEVLFYVEVTEDAYIGGKASILAPFSSDRILIAESAKVTGNAKIANASGESKNKETSIIGGRAHFFGNSSTRNIEYATGDVKIFGNAKIKSGSTLYGATQVFGDAIVYNDAKLTGNTQVSGDAIIGTSAVLNDCIVKGKATIGINEIFSDATFEDEAVYVNEKKVKPEIVVNQRGISGRSEKPALEAAPIKQDNKEQKLLNRFAAIKNDIASYETDIVKIIKYPVMTDRTDSYTMEMVMALKDAQRLADDPADPEFKDAIVQLEKKFLAAESNALKIASTALSDEDKKKTEKAKDLLAIAADEGSSENEKKVSFKQAFKQLEGVIVVPEVAVDTFRVKIGLKELEM